MTTDSDSILHTLNGRPVRRGDRRDRMKFKDGAPVGSYGPNHPAERGEFVAIKVYHHATGTYFEDAKYRTLLDRDAAFADAAETEGKPKRPTYADSDTSPRIGDEVSCVFSWATDAGEGRSACGPYPSTKVTHVSLDGAFLTDRNKGYYQPNEAGRFRLLSRAPTPQPSHLAPDNHACGATCDHVCNRCGYIQCPRENGSGDCLSCGGEATVVEKQAPVAAPVRPAMNPYDQLAAFTTSVREAFEAQGMRTRLPKDAADAMAVTVCGDVDGKLRRPFVECSFRDAGTHRLSLCNDGDVEAETPGGVLIAPHSAASAVRRIVEYWTQQLGSRALGKAE